LDAPALLAGFEACFLFSHTAQTPIARNRFRRSEPVSLLFFIGISSNAAEPAR
jgi:hypothetical protein